MATLVTTHPDGRETRTPVFKSLTTIGSDPESDVQIDGAAPLAAHISYDGNAFTIASSDKRTDIIVSGKMVRKQTLVDGDEITIGAFRMRFALKERGSAPPTPASTPEAREQQAYRRLVAFSKKLGAAREIPAVLEALMDEVIALTHADKGFLVLLEDTVGEDGAVERSPRIKMARNVKGEAMDDEVRRLSDSILRRAIETGQPIVVSDALSSTQFSSSRSVVSLKLTSVMCVPLLHQGVVFGAIYVGNDSVANLFDEASLELLTLFAAQAALLVQNALHINALTLETAGLKSELERSRYGELVGSCDGMREVFKKIEKVARADISVLVTGETGTGKELIAREVHKRSQRARGPFVVINCGAIPENLLESELFGHVKGAFTGAVATRQGRFHAAHGGTLFLDEIGEMPLHLQVKLLRALQERQVTRVGDNRPENVDIRVVAATHRNLEQMVRDGTFREDLYYRLNMIELKIPPLRERKEDIPHFIEFFARKFADRYRLPVWEPSPEALAEFCAFPWPGNVRQLEHAIEQGYVLQTDPRVPARPGAKPAGSGRLPCLDLAKLRAQAIKEALEMTRGHKAHAAKLLGVHANTMTRLLKELETGGDAADSDAAE